MVQLVPHVCNCHAHVFGLNSGLRIAVAVSVPGWLAAVDYFVLVAAGLVSGVGLEAAEVLVSAGLIIDPGVLVAG